MMLLNEKKKSHSEIMLQCKASGVHLLWLGEIWGPGWHPHSGSSCWTSNCNGPTYHEFGNSHWTIFGNHFMSLLIFLGGNWKQIKNVLKYWSVLRWKSESEVAQSCLSLCDPMDYNLPGFSVHGIFQARVLEWVAISFSRGSSWPKDQTQVSCIASRCFTLWATKETPYMFVVCD